MFATHSGRMHRNRRVVAVPTLPTHVNPEAPPQNRDAITLEWIAGVVVFLIAYFLGLYELRDTAWPRWLFRADVMDGARKVLQFVGMKVPKNVNGDALRLDPLVKRKHPPATRYRVLVSASTLTCGISKAVLSYRGQDTAATTVEWIYGVVIILSIYWLVLYDSEAGISNGQPPFSSKPKHLRVTGYHILVTTSTAGFGLAKAALLYHGRGRAANAVELVYGVVVTLS
ncbi:hypothetical protein MD484_g1681, partial [Candolleomyces efflorescens]